VKSFETYPSFESSRVCARRAAGDVVRYHLVVASEGCLMECKRWDHAYAYTTAPGKAVHVASYTEAKGKKPPKAFRDAPPCETIGRDLSKPAAK
jgi:hypothetical protein